jgi:hypothetical protein
VRKFSEGIRVDKLRRDSSFVIPWRGPRRRFEQEGALEREKSLRRRNRRPGFAGRFAKSRRPSDLGEVARGFSP